MPTDPVAPYDPYAAVRAAENGQEVTVPPSTASDYQAGIDRVRAAQADVPPNDISTDKPVTSVDPVATQADTAANGPTITALNDDGTAGVTMTSEEASNLAAMTQKAQAQQTLASQTGQQNNKDWRLRLSLAPQANYLYCDPNPGILAPLRATGGVVFPYTPRISMNYRGNYSPVDVTHANYRTYFYQNSYVDAVQVSAKFTAQTTFEANYLLAVIHFFRSVTKMFYGQDALRGSPPPVTYLNGFGQYQFNSLPCVVQNFTYNLPDDVDYIRAGSTVENGNNQTGARDLAGSGIGSMFGSLNRLANAFLPKGAIPTPGWLQQPPGTLNVKNPTYVPTKMEMNITLFPVQSRNQVSQQFSLKSYANGSLLQGGFW